VTANSKRPNAATAAFNLETVATAAFNLETVATAAFNLEIAATAAFNPETAATAAFNSTEKPQLDAPEWAAMGRAGKAQRRRGVSPRQTVPGHKQS